MANQKILDKKQEIVNEISDNIKNSSSTIFFDYQGLTAMETNELRGLLKENGSKLKIYKNTLVKRALDSLKISLNEDLEGPKAVAFGTDAVAPIKTLSDYAKKHPALVLKVGLVEGELTDEAKLKELSSIPSREGLLTILASGLMGTVRDLSICLDLYSEQLEENN